MFFHPNWHTHHRPSVDSSHKATIQIWRGTTDEASWTPEDGLVTPEDHLVYEGLARWQKVGYTTQRDFAADTAMFQRVRVQISFDRFEDYTQGQEKLQVNDRIVLIENNSNPMSEGSIVYIWGIPTSSNAWNITINAQENFKQVSDG